MFSNRNHIPMNDPLVDSDDVDTVYETCNQELHSEARVHKSFQTARHEAHWARDYVIYEVIRIRIRDKIYLSYYQCLEIARRISNDWFLARAQEEISNETTR